MPRKSLSARSDIKQIVKDIPENPASTVIVNEIYDKLKLQIKDILDSGVSVTNIVVIVAEAMKIIGKFKTLTGIEKKALAITVVHKLIIESNIPEDNRDAIFAVIDLMLDPLIDQLYSLAPLAYGKIKEGCLSCCFKSSAAK